MSTPRPHHTPALVRHHEAEVLTAATTTIRLLADFDTTDGAISANRTNLEAGAAGPPPHYHAGSAEIFFVIDGVLDALAGDRVVQLETGDFLVVPKEMPHAFSATSDSPVDVLIVFAPAVKKRFDYFRLVNRVLKGQAHPREILDASERFDNHWVDSPLWPSRPWERRE